MYRAVESYLLRIGSCSHPEHAVLGKISLKVRDFPTTVVLIKHPERGYILFDCGYSDKFFEATQKYPYRIYAKFTPVEIPEDQKIENQLAKFGIEPDQISYIIISHFHADHIGSIQQFKKAKFIVYKSAYDQVKNLTSFKALLNAFLPMLLPKDFSERALWIEDIPNNKMLKEFLPFNNAVDLFNDGSLFVVALEGHTQGQAGLIINDEQRGLMFFCADACYLKESYEENRPPSPIARIITYNWPLYLQNISKLHELYKSNPNVKIIPNHCAKTFAEIGHK